MTSSSSSLFQFGSEYVEIAPEELKILGILGKGGYGEVLRARWQGREVACKRLVHLHAMNGALRTEFQHEAAVMLRLHHPNIVQTFGAHLPDGRHGASDVPFIVTELAPSGSLFEYCRKTRLEPPRQLEVLRDIACGMMYLATKAKLVHRDLKSLNVLMFRDGTAKLCDFGLAKIKHESTKNATSTIGTPQWCAPEVLRGEAQHSERTDVFSFGVIAWEISTQKFPWEGMQPSAVVGVAGLQDRRLPIPEGTPPQIRELIERCWGRPSERPTFSRLVTYIEKCLAAHRPGTESPAPPPTWESTADSTGLFSTLQELAATAYSTVEQLLKPSQTQQMQLAGPKPPPPSPGPSNARPTTPGPQATGPRPRPPPAPLAGGSGEPLKILPPDQAIRPGAAVAAAPEPPLPPPPPGYPAPDAGYANALLSPRYQNVSPGYIAAGGPYYGVPVDPGGFNWGYGGGAGHNNVDAAAVMSYYDTKRSPWYKRMFRSATALPRNRAVYHQRPESLQELASSSPELSTATYAPGGVWNFWGSRHPPQKFPNSDLKARDRRGRSVFSAGGSRFESAEVSLFDFFSFFKGCAVTVGDIGCKDC
eukprot:tig00020556_g11052.t1